MTISRRIALASALLLLIAGLFVLAVLFAGAGHGSSFFYLVLVAPFSAFGGSFWYAAASILLWLGIAVSFPFLRSMPVRIGVIFALLAHYLGVVIVAIRASDWDYVGGVWQAAPWLVLLFVACYLTAQMIVWFVVARRHAVA